MERWSNQIRAFEGTIDALNRGVKRLCVTSPTGSGKSLCYRDVIRWACEHHKRVALYTLRRMLFDQTCAGLAKDGISFGMRASGYDPALLRDVQVCMIQTEIAKRRSEARDLHPADIVLVDEWHLFGGNKFQEIIGAHIGDGSQVVGYSATPMDLPPTDELLVAGWPSECRKFGALVAAETYAPDEPDLKHIKRYVVGEDLTEKENTTAIMRPGVFGRVINAWKMHNPDQRPTLLFGPDVKGSLWFAQQFHEAGIRAAHIDGEDCWLDGEFHASDTATRDHIAALSRSGQVKVVCNRWVLKEGIDWPWIECGILASVIGSLTSYLQICGRLLRACPETGKSTATILDHGGAWWRHGSVNEDREWTLGMTNHRVVGERLDRLRERKEPEPIVCPQCGKVRRSGRVCMVCGFEAHKRSRLVVQVNGALKPVEGAIQKPRRVKREPNTEMLWRVMLKRARSEKWGATFRQAEAKFYLENYYYPPRDLPGMPKESSDFWRKVSEVPPESLIQKTDATTAPAT